MKTRSYRYAYHGTRALYVAWSFAASPLTRRGCFDPAVVCAEGQTATECLAKLPRGADVRKVCGPVRDEIIDGRPATWKEENGKIVIVPPPPLELPADSRHLRVIRA